MPYHLLDHCNARNAAELARTDLDARALVTLEWVPPHVLMWGPGDWRSLHSQGMKILHGTRGDKIRCGMPLLPGQHIHTRQLDSKHYNVCRPFDEAWERPSPFYYTGLRPLCCEAVGGHPRIVEGMELTYGQPLKTENFSITRHTPPNHGHGAVCGCVFALKIRPVDCPECAGTGRVICDDDRAGRVSPSHAAGGYAEWQRPSSVVGHVASQVPPELAGIYATDGDPATTERRR